MKKILAILTLVLLLPFSIQEVQSQAYGGLNSRAFIYGNTTVYGIDGYGLNVTLTVNNPAQSSNGTLVSFVLNISESFNARGTLVNSDGYDVNRSSLNFYLNSGVVLDFDRSRVIDALWINWGNSLNATHLHEENSLYASNYGVNFTKSGSTYFGTAFIPEISLGQHNVTVWVRAEQDQVTTYTPFWSAFSNTVDFANQLQTSTPIPEFPSLTFLALLSASLVATTVLVIIRRKVQRFMFHNQM